MAIAERDLRRFLVDRIARCCELPAADVDPDRLLEQYGIASRDAVAITAELEDVLGRQLEPASLWRYPTLNQLIRGVLGGTHPDGIPITPLDPLTGDEIAVIGVARRDTTDERIPWEVAREALERAGIPAFAESRTAVFGTEAPLLGPTCPANPTSTPVATAIASLRAGSSDIALTVLPEPSRSCQMVVLKRLPDAERDFDQILALCTDPDSEPVADFLEAVLAADRGITDELLPWPVGRTVSTSEALVRRPRPAEPTPSSGPTRLLLSDVSIDLIQEYAGTLAAYLRDDLSRNTADVAHTLVRRIARGPVRAAVVGRARADLTAGLTALAQGNDHPGVLSAIATPHPPKPVWVFPDQPGDAAGLRELAESVPAFVGVIAELDPLMSWAAGVSLREAVLTGTIPPGDELPVAYAVQLALALSWQQYGVTPAAIVADGAGEVAAAVLAGALTATEGARVIAAQSRTPDQLAPMLADLAPAAPRLPFYSATSTDAPPFGAEYWTANLKQPYALGTTLSRAAAEGHGLFLHLTADALDFHTQLATLEVLGHPIIAPPGRVTDLPLAPWYPAP
jgi:acyl carrier protein